MEETVGAGVGLVLGLLIVVVFGALVGWLAGLIFKGSGFGLGGDIVVGIAGAFLAGFLLPRFGIGVDGVAGSIIAAVIGAVIVLLFVKMIRRNT